MTSVTWDKNDGVNMTQFMQSHTGHKFKAIIDDAIVNTAFGNKLSNSQRIAMLVLRQKIFDLINPDLLKDGVD